MSTSDHKGQHESSYNGCQGLGMKSNEWFKKLFEQLKPVLASSGFKKNGNAFIKKLSESEVAFGFRKSRETSADELILTCSLGIRYFALDKYFREDPPLHMQAHLTADKTVMCRELAGGNSEGFWRIDSDESYEVAAKQIFELMPTIISLIDEYALLETYATEYMQLIKLAAQGRLKINVKEATVVAAYLLEVKQLEKAEKMIEELRDIALKDGVGTNALDVTWSYILQKNRAS